MAITARMTKINIATMQTMRITSMNMPESDNNITRNIERKFSFRSKLWSV